MALAKYDWKNVILSMQVLVRAVGVKLHKVSSAQMTVFLVCRHVVRQTQDPNWKRTRVGAVWQFVSTLRLGLEV